MMEPIWLTVEDVTWIHDAQINEFGGARGTRDETLLLSALGRPRHKWAYGETSLQAMAAGYAFGIVKNHPFIDGNKRTAFAACVVFLMINGERLTASQSDATAAMLRLAASELSEVEFAGWLAEHDV